MSRTTVITLLGVVTLLLCNMGRANAGYWEGSSGYTIDPDSIVVVEVGDGVATYIENDASVSAECYGPGSEAAVQAFYYKDFQWVGGGTPTTLTVATKGILNGGCDAGDIARSCFEPADGIGPVWFCSAATDPIWWYDDRPTESQSWNGVVGVSVPVGLEAECTDSGFAYSDAIMWIVP